ncbi:MAG: hypothetical protein DBX55_07880 [Verrucomicrobia bacterium]|nr:MAG: hypothetical protein DBX55_07880 [Verrucomicrobiota bacterium]
MVGGSNPPSGIAHKNPLFRSEAFVYEDCSLFRAQTFPNIDEYKNPFLFTKFAVFATFATDEKSAVSILSGTP